MLYANILANIFPNMSKFRKIAGKCDVMLHRNILDLTFKISHSFATQKTHVVTLNRFNSFVKCRHPLKKMLATWKKIKLI